MADDKLPEIKEVEATKLDPTKKYLFVVRGAFKQESLQSFGKAMHAAGINGLTLVFQDGQDYEIVEVNE